MAKKKKEVNGPNIDHAVESAKKTESALQGLLQRVSEGKGYFRRKDKEEELIPQLNYETRVSIAEQYATEDDLLANAAERQRIRDEKAKKYASLMAKIAEKKAEIQEVEVPEAKTEIYIKLSRFFENLINSKIMIHISWENSISNLLSILRKMRKITKKNTEDLTLSIKNIFEKTQKGLKEFKIKRDEIEKVAGVNIENMSMEFKKVLGLLELEIKEYQLKRFTDELMHYRKLLT